MLGVLDAAPDAIVAASPDGRIVYANAGAIELFGYSPAELVGEPVELLVPHDRRSVHPGHRKAYLADPRPRPMGAQLELSAQRKDGTTFPAEISLRHVDTGSGDVVVAAIRDVTELRRTQARFRGLVEGASDAIVAIDDEGRLVLLNTQAEARFKCHRNDLLGAAIVELISGPATTAETLSTPGAVHPSDRVPLLDAIADVLHRRAASLSLRYRIADDAGRWTVLEAQGQPVADATGRTESLLLISRDVTAQVQLEADLREAKDAADRASEAKNHFLSRVSHELRTPLNAVLGFAQVLELEASDEIDQEAVKQILQGGGHLLQLINEVLDISRIEAGDLALSVEPVQVSDLVSELVKLLAPTARQAGVTLDPASIDNTRVHVLADVQRLKQVLVNLISNAIKYNRRGGAVAINCVPYGEAWTHIHVSDEGSGISAVDQARLFQPFERLQAGASSIEGTGIGLALAKGLTEAMGGALSVQSVVGQGSTFVVELPTYATAAPTARSVPIATPAVHLPGAAHRCTIVHIEDNLANARLVSRILERLSNVEVLLATTGEAGIVLAEDASAAVVVLDMHLSDLGGDQILRRLRSNPATAAVPVVVLSADATRAQVDRLLRLGASAYLTKPIDVAELLQAVQALLPAGQT